MKSWVMSAARCLMALVMATTMVMATVVPMTTPAEAGVLTRYVVGRTLVRAEMRWARRAARKSFTRRAERYAARDFGREVLAPLPRNPGFASLSRKQSKVIGDRIKKRVATREEFRQAYSQERFNNRRLKGVDEFWAQEKDRLRQGLPGSRNWNQAQYEAILKGKRPQFEGKAFEGHHMYSARTYPQIADNPKNIVGATPREHFQKWHGGDYTPPTHGLPRNPSFRDQM